MPPMPPLWPPWAGSVVGGGLTENIASSGAPNVLSNFAVWWNNGDWIAGANPNHVAGFRDVADDGPEMSGSSADFDVPYAQAFYGFVSCFNGTKKL